MHILDDPSGLSGRARAFLARVADRAEDIGHRPTEYMRVRDANGHVIPAPFELVIRREGFAQRFGGLRYPVRTIALMPDGPYLDRRWWRFDLDDHARQDRRGWYFSWYGEQVSSPVRYLQHTDGRFGVSDSDRFIPVYPTMLHLIESHALLDACSDWEPHRGFPEGIDKAELIAELPPVPEASGP
ncbi:hypothetical protein GCM10009780_81430 [Actinomadura alba]